MSTSAVRATAGALFDAQFRETQSVVLVDGKGVQAPVLRVGPCADDEETPCHVGDIEAHEVEVGAIHDVEGAGLRNEDIRDLHIAGLAFGDVNEGRDTALWIKKSMRFDGRPGRAEQSPWEDREAQIGGRGVGRAHGLVALNAEVLAGVERACDGDRFPGEFCMDALGRVGR